MVNAIIPNNNILNIDKGTICRLSLNTKLKVKGILVCNGTIEEPVILDSSSSEKSNNNYIEISNSGTLLSNNTIINFNNSSDTYGSIRNSGNLYLLNTNIKTSSKTKTAIYIMSGSKENVIKYNYIEGKITNSSGKKIDLTYNYWGTTD